MVSESHIVFRTTTPPSTTTALGMIEPYHYQLLVVQGRVDASKGTYLTWLADKMLEKGVTEALNLDGGGTVSLMFMGEIINKPNKNLRSITSLIGFGNSELVPDPK